MQSGMGLFDGFECRKELSGKIAHNFRANGESHTNSILRPKSYVQFRLFRHCEEQLLSRYSGESESLP
jgi:hypothetical protein